jgi:hypothetical protein
VLVACLAAAQTPDAIAELIQAARMVPAEFGSDALLRIAESGVLRDRKEKAALIEEAFEMATGATFQTELSPALQNLHADSRYGTLYSAYHLKLDAMSLKCRAVQAMLPLEKAKARELFNQLPPLRIPSYACNDAMVFNPQYYWETVKAVVQTGFTPEELAKEEHLRFAESMVRSMTSMNQAEPVAEMIRDLNSGPEQFAVLLSAFSTALGTVDISDRVFGVPLGLNQRIWELTDKCRKNGIFSDGLVRAYRSLLVRHFSGPRCADNIAWGLNQNQKGAMMDPLAHVFNSAGLRQPPNTSSELPPLSDQEMTPIKVINDVLDQHDYWTTPEAANFSGELRRLTQHQTPDWQTEVHDFVKRMDAWKPDAEASPADYFHQKCFLYEGLIETAPAGDVRDSVISNYVRYLSASPMQRDSPVEWFQTAWGLVRLLRDSSLNETADTVLTEFERSGSTVLTLYSRMDRILPPQPK